MPFLWPKKVETLRFRQECPLNFLVRNLPEIGIKPQWTNPDVEFPVNFTPAMHAGLVAKGLSFPEIFAAARYSRLDFKRFWQDFWEQGSKLNNTSLEKRRTASETYNLLVPNSLSTVYNSFTMLPKQTAKRICEDPCLLDAVELFHLCATDRENTEAWGELLRRYASKIRYFIGGTLRQFLGYSAFRKDSIALGGIQECDLFQNAIIRLVKNDCAAMKKFSGKSEGELLAYLAVICRSSVLDALRRNGALKRQASLIETRASLGEMVASRESAGYSGFEREILAKELLSLTHGAIESYSGNVSNRDRLVFELYFVDGLSYSQIARCRGINLSKAGVEKLLKRLMGRVQTLVSSGKSGEMLQ